MECTVTYEAVYGYYWCYDDGGLGHDTSTSESTVKLEATSNNEARLLAQDLNRKYQQGPKHCHCHPGPKWIKEVRKTTHEKTDDGFERTAVHTLTLPAIYACLCGKKYTPLRGEKVCHTLVLVSKTESTSTK